MATTTKDIKQMALDIHEQATTEYPYADPYEVRDELVRIYQREEELTLTELGQLTRALSELGI